MVPVIIMRFEKLCFRVTHFWKWPQNIQKTVLNTMDKQELQFYMKILAIFPPCNFLHFSLECHGVWNWHPFLDGGEKVDKISQWDLDSKKRWRKKGRKRRREKRESDSEREKKARKQNRKKGRELPFSLFFHGFYLFPLFFLSFSASLSLSAFPPLSASLFFCIFFMWTKIQKNTTMRLGK